MDKSRRNKPLKPSYESDGEMSKKQAPEDKEQEINRDFFNTTQNSE